MFILVLAFESVSEAFEKIKEGQKADFYKDMLNMTVRPTRILKIQETEQIRECMRAREC